MEIPALIKLVKSPELIYMVAPEGEIRSYDLSSLQEVLSTKIIDPLTSRSFSETSIIQLLYLVSGSVFLIVTPDKIRGPFDSDGRLEIYPFPSELESKAYSEGVSLSELAMIPTWQQYLGSGVYGRVCRLGTQDVATKKVKTENFDFLRESSAIKLLTKLGGRFGTGSSRGYPSLHAFSICGDETRLYYDVYGGDLGTFYSKEGFHRRVSELIKQLNSQRWNHKDPFYTPFYNKAVQILHTGTPEPLVKFRELLKGSTTISTPEYFRREMDFIEQWSFAPRFPEIFYQVLKGLYLSELCGLLHLDLKPENILLHSLEVDRPVTALADWGSSRWLFAGPIVTDQSFQTRWYRAPEVAIGKVPTTASDIWSLGMVLRQLLRGIDTPDSNYELLRQIERDYEILRDHVTENYQTSKLPLRILQGLEKHPAYELLEKCLNLSPSHRASPRELLNLPLFQEFREREPEDNSLLVAAVSADSPEDNKVVPMETSVNECKLVERKGRIYRSFTARERLQLLPCHPLGISMASMQPDLTSTYRLVVINWLGDVVHTEGLTSSALIYSIELLDYVLRLQVTPKINYQAVAILCLNISLYLLGEPYYTIKSCCEFCAGAYTVPVLREMFKLICSGTGGDFYFINPYIILRQLYPEKNYLPWVIAKLWAPSRFSEPLKDPWVIVDTILAEGVEPIKELQAQIGECRWPSYFKLWQPLQNARS